MKLVVLDTNVLAPGFVGHASTSVQLIHLWQAGAYELVVSEHLLGELTRTFANPYYRQRISDAQVERVVTLLRHAAHLTPITVSVDGVATQPKDDLVLATCLSAGASWLATRDRQLLKLQHYQGLEIVPPGRLLAILETDDESGI